MISFWTSINRRSKVQRNTGARLGSSRVLHWKRLVRPWVDSSPAVGKFDSLPRSTSSYDTALTAPREAVAASLRIGRARLLPQLLHLPLSFFHGRLKRGLDVAVKTVESEAEVNRPTVPEFGSGWHAQHGRVSNACMMAAIASGRASTGNRWMVLDGNTTSIGGPAGDGVRRMGTRVDRTLAGDVTSPARVRFHT
jgi:hypothetical protein